MFISISAFFLSANISRNQKENLNTVKNYPYNRFANAGPIPFRRDTRL